MGRNRYDSEQSRLELEALHAAVLSIQRREGCIGKPINTRDWERIVITALGSMTRQACNEKTWAMDRLGLLERVAVPNGKGRPGGVKLLEVTA